MDSDVWKSELSVFVSAITLIWIFVFVFVFNMDIFESDFQYYLNLTLSEISEKNPTLFVSAKVKYP
jgi:hypothetical protein